MSILGVASPGAYSLKLRLRETYLDRGGTMP